MPKNHPKTMMHNKAVIIVALFLLPVLATNIATYMLTKSYFTKRYKGECTTVESKKMCSGELVGLSEENAIRLAKERGFKPLVVQRNGKNIFHTFEGDRFRVSLWVSDDSVTQAEFYR